MIDAEVNGADVFASSMSELGIDASLLDASDLEMTADTESTEAEGEEVIEEEVETEDNDEVEASDETEAPEGEEKEEVAPTTEEDESESPKLTAKEFREIEAARVELEAQQKAFQEEKQNLEKEFQTKYQDKVKTHDELDAFFSHLADKDPELFDLLAGEFKEHQKQFSNPMLDKTRQEISEIKKELEGFKSRATDEVTLTKLDADMEKFNSSIGKEAETAGLKIDRKAIEDLWAKGLTVEEAFYAKYGAAFASAKVSKAKVEAATKKAAARPVVNTAGNVGRSNTKAPADVPSDAFDAVRYFAKQFSGKAS